MPSDTNVSLEIFEKLSKHKDLEIEVTKMWHFKTTALPVVIGALGIVAKAAPKCFADPWSSVFNRTSKNNTHWHILRKVLSM